MDDQEVLYVDVLLPLHLPDTYTYRVPRELNDDVRIGVRVVVQFGQRGNKMYSALIRRIHTNSPRLRSKYIMAVLDAEPIVSELQMKFWDWMARYYMCYPGDVMQIALPAGMKLASESTITIHPDFDGELSSLTKYERQVVDLLSTHPLMKLDNISRALGIQKIMPLIRTMIECGIVEMEEELRERFVPRKSTYISLAEPYLNDDNARQLFDDLERRKCTKQLEFLMQFMQLSKFGKQPVPKRDIPQGSTINTLLKKGILSAEERVESRLASSDIEIVPASNIQLNDEQQAAFDILNSHERDVNILYGVTSSGKTEVYIKLIDREVQAGHQVLFLLPEIALTTQIINRLRCYFGDKVGVYHSRFSASQRVEVWQRTKTTGDGRYQVLLGARSALLLPFNDLSLVIVDEEHDASYKQYDPAPRYHARDSAIYLATLWKARTVLGSATPSIETYHNAMTGKYGIAKLTQRWGGFHMPHIERVDMRQMSHDNQVRGSFSQTLLDAIKKALAKQQQVILFQNRRGFSLRLECDDCHEVPHCINCDVSLVYHKASNSLRCHYCGYSIPVPSECPACNSTHLRMTGIGTERIEEDLQILFPDANIARMDLDSTMQKNQYVEILNDFASRKIDILVGTQMVTKGLDFENVSVVGVINADNIINYPNFRSYERAFQQMTQVSGRAGRHGDDGQVIIQTYNPSHQVIEQVLNNDYESLYSNQNNERRVFRYPPYYRLIEITLRHREQDLLNKATDWMATQLRGVFGNRVMGPEYPLVSRVRGLYLKQITLRFEKNEAIAEAKQVMIKMANDLTMHEGWRSVSIHFDVDPY